MASKKNETAKDDKKGYQPKATARHARMTKTKQEEIDALKKRIDTDKYLAKKYESSRKTEIKSLPRGDRAAAKAELKESIAKRKEAESRDREKLRALMWEEKKEKVAVEKSPFDEEAWVSGGKKKTRKEEAPEAPAEAVPAAEDVPAASAAQPDVQTVPESPPPEPVPEQAEAPEKKD